MGLQYDLLDLSFLEIVRVFKFSSTVELTIETISESVSSDTGFLFSALLTAPSGALPFLSYKLVYRTLS